MASVPFLLLHLLSLLLLSCTTALANVHPPAAAPAPYRHGGHHHRHHSPALAPVPAHKPPFHYPAKAPYPHHPKSPAIPPAHPPTHSIMRKLVAVQGVVYCKPCKYVGIDTLVGATPLQGAVVKLHCNNTKIGMTVEAKTDAHGYFWVSPKMLTTAAFHKCRVSLVSSPSKVCSVASALRGGAAGALLIPEMKEPVKWTPYQQFNVGPFAFEPVKKCLY